MSEIFRESEIALEKKGPAQESFLRLRQDQRRRDTHAAFHHAAVGRHRETPRIITGLALRAQAGVLHAQIAEFPELSLALHEAGFDKTVRCAPMQTLSPIPQLRDLETRYGPDAPEWVFARTLIIEGEKSKTTAPSALKQARRVAQIAESERRESRESEPAHTS